MPEKDHQREILIEKRARALAMMLLTRREDLLIEEVTEDIGLSYLVRFHGDGKEGLREFGVALKGVWAAASKERADKAFRSFLRQMKPYSPFLRPVCAFLFAMEADEAWSTWVAEPVEAEDGTPRLRSCAEPDCRQLDTQALNEMIQRVDAWYDAIFPRLIANGPGASKTDRKRAKG